MIQNLKIYLRVSVIAMMFFIALSALAQSFPGAPVLDAPPSSEEISAFLAQLKGLSGPLAIALAVAQGLLLLSRFFGVFQKVTQRTGLIISAAAHLVVGVITLLVQGYDWGTILVNSGFLVLLGNYAFQIYQSFMTPKGLK